MKPENPQQSSDELRPLDDFEAEWVSLLQQKDADTLADSEAFTDEVIHRLERERGRAVLAKIGFWQPMAVAATIALAASAVWFIQYHQSKPAGPIAKTPTPPLTQAPSESGDEQAPIAVVQNSPDPAEVGRIIGEFSRSLNRPAMTEQPKPPAPLQRVIELFDQPLGNPTEFLPQRSTTDRG